MDKSKVPVGTVRPVPIHMRHADGFAVVEALAAGRARVPLPLRNLLPTAREVSPSHPAGPVSPVIGERRIVGRVAVFHHRPAHDFDRGWMDHERTRLLVHKGVAEVRAVIVPPEVFPHPPVFQLPRMGTVAPATLPDMDIVFDP